MLDSLRNEVTEKLALIRPLTDEERKAMIAEMAAQETSLPPEPAADAEPIAPNVKASAPKFNENDPSTWGKPGRNDPCPCGSGKKFKHCHGRLV